MNVGHKKIKAGDTFKTSEGGSVVVIEYRDSKNVVIEHNDEFRHRASIPSSQLRSGSIKNPYKAKVYGRGYVGVGAHKTAENGKDTPAYKSWCAMLRRAYSAEYHAKNSAYRDVTVCDEWLNFQAYANWWSQQPHSGNRDFELDKDLRISGNREYSPDACSFVPSVVNRLIGKRCRPDASMPQGVKACRHGFEARVGVSGQYLSLGVFATPERAFQEYRDAKEESVRSAANQWRSLLHPEVYQYLKSWKLNSGD